ncbi:hypothetical protein D9758_016075 [Tetrapyrgos nigripes]|uniref:alpha-galactosidase n=1 Tax=Tetrapyrgos nigripes TaxID=182062 RepID=A0A8H5C305_9AGAR|nr:hypothetical protein D9758_016075 [Tetrapyrgos nigripes]
MAVYDVFAQFSLAITQVFHFLLTLTNISPSNVGFAPYPYEPPPLYPLSISQTPHGFSHSARGWNSFGIQANPLTNPNFVFNQEHVMAQCDVLARPPFSTLGSVVFGNDSNANEEKTGNGLFYTYCSLDSGWSAWDHGDEYGRIIADKRVFDIPKLAEHLHKRGLQLGLYVVPGGFHKDMNKTILGTKNITIGDVCSGDNGLLRCNWHYGQDGVQQWHDSVVEQFARWGVDFIKLDFVTPGSPMLLPKNSSGSVIAYHRAISKLSKLPNSNSRPNRPNHPIRLAISWKLARDPTHFSIWSSHADSFRTDQDINNAGAESARFTRWEVVQRAMNEYRGYVEGHARKHMQTEMGEGMGEVLTIHPDMDNLYVGNGEEIDGVDDRMRRTMVNHWVGAGANLMLGSDLTGLDATGLSLLTNPTILSLAHCFTSRFPMRPRNPGTGLGHSRQLQAWIAGPDPETGDAVVLLVNYGVDLGQGGFGGTGEEFEKELGGSEDSKGARSKSESRGEGITGGTMGGKGPQTVFVSSNDLGLGLGRVGEAGGAVGMQWEVRDAWGESEEGTNFLGVLQSGSGSDLAELKDRGFRTSLRGLQDDAQRQRSFELSPGVGILDVTPGKTRKDSENAHDDYGNDSHSGNGMESDSMMAGSVLMANLAEGESVLLMLKPVGEWKL